MGSTEGSYEYLVFNSTFLGVAKKHGLTPLVDWGDPDLDACFDEARALVMVQSCLYGAKVQARIWHLESHAHRGVPYPVNVPLDMQADLHKPIKHFRPKFPPESDPSLAKASALFAAFAFQKGMAPAAPEANDGHRNSGMHQHLSAAAVALPRGWAART